MCKKNHGGIGLLLITMIFAFLFGACSGSREIVYVFNWSDYIKEELLEQFEKETGIRVVLDYFDSNEAMFAKLRAGASGYDLVFPTSYMVQIMAQHDMLQKIDHSQLGNLQNLDEKYLALSEDPDIIYSVPYMISATGIGYLESRVGEMETVSWDIFGDSRFAGRMTMLNDYREAIGAALKFLGYSYNSTNVRELEAARDQLIVWKRNLAKFEADQYKNGLVSGEFFVSQGYSGDILMAMEENEDIQFALPVEGTTLSLDTMVLLKDAKNVDNAYKFINFLLDAEVAAENIEYIYYLAPNKAAYPLVDEEIRNDPSVFFPDELVEKSEFLLDLGDYNALYSRIWEEVRAAPTN